MQVAIHFVGRNVMETKRCTLVGRQRQPVGASSLQQAVGTDNIGVDKIGRAVDRTVDMRLGCQVHDGMRLEALEYSADSCLIGNVGLDELVAGIGRDAGQRFQVTGIGQLVQVEHFVLGIVDQVTHQRRTDESGSAGDENSHV
ncbi:hypothetical protein D3C77_539040 [compost metagenome]